MIKVKARIVASMLGTTLLLSGVAACSSSGSSSKPPSSGTPTTSAALTAAQIKTMLDYTGGKAGKATGSPVTIGLVNSQGGANAFPEFTTAITAAVQLVNSQLGGVHGHRLELDTCFIANSDAQGQTCAQQFLAKPNVVAVLQASVDTGIQPFHATIGGRIPVIGFNPTDLSDASAANSYYIEGGQFSALTIVTYLQKYLKAKKVALLSASGIPVAVQAAAALKSAMQAAGIKVTQATYSPTATDFVAPLTASGATSADAVVPLVITPQQCVAVANAAKQISLSTQVVSLSACLGSSVKDALGDYPKWDYLDFTVNPDAKDANPTTQAQVDAYNAWVPPIKAEIPDPGAAVQSLQSVLTMVKLANATAGTPTRASMGAAAKAFTGPVFLGAPKLAFGVNPALPRIGTTSARFYAYKGDGAWTDLTNGQWLDAPAGGPPGGGTIPSGAPSGAPSGIPSGAPSSG